MQPPVLADRSGNVLSCPREPLYSLELSLQLKYCRMLTLRLMYSILPRLQILLLLFWTQILNLPLLPRRAPLALLLIRVPY
jgi:hypothetical protein